VREKDFRGEGMGSHGRGRRDTEVREERDLQERAGRGT
jgi:hypothetical protein